MQLATSFVRIAAEWSTTNALAILQSVDVAYAVIDRRDATGRELFYVFGSHDLTARLSVRAGAVVDALGLLDLPATPTVSSPDPHASNLAIVVSAGRIVGLSVPDLAGRGEDDQQALAATAPPAGGQRGLTATLSTEIAVGAQVSLLVKIVKEVIGPVVQLAATRGEQVSLVVQASGGVELVGDSEALVTIDDAAELVHQFKVRGRTVGDGALTVYAFKAGAGVATVTVTTRVVAGVADGSANVATAELPSSTTSPELVIYILEDKAAHTYGMRVSSSDGKLNFQDFGKITLTEDVDQFFTTFFAEIETILRSPGDPPAKAGALASKGSYLMGKVMPPAMRDQLWSMRGHITSIQIQSEEPWVPWELCKLSGMEDGRIVDGRFLSEEFIVTRWFPGVPEQRELSLRSIGLIVPPDSGLPAAPAEKQCVAGLAQDGRTVTELASDPVALRAALAGGTFDGLHFSGHGSGDPVDPDHSTIVLAQNQRLSPQDLSGAVANLGLMHPVVFLNACQIGRSGTSLGSLTGWPQAFIRAGAGAFIGPYWSIGDGSASQFAQTFYRALLVDKVTVGRAVHLAREAVRNDIDPTWLAYVVYAHPEARILP
jgi:CHAT domain